MALSAVQPMLMDFMDTLASRGSDDGKVMAEIVVEEEAAVLAGRTIAEVFPPDSGLQVMGVERAAGGLQVGPRGDSVIALGDRLMVYGDGSAVEQLAAPSARR